MKIEFVHVTVFKGLFYLRTMHIAQLR